MNQLAQRHDTAVVFLSSKEPEEMSLGSLVSLRASVQRLRRGEAFLAALSVLKDKRNGPSWRYEASYHGPVDCG